MTSLMFTIYDAKADAYLAPFQANTLGVAERMFTELVNEPGHTFNRHPEDYTLYCVGKFDSHTAELQPDKHTAMANGLTVLESATDSIPMSLASSN